MVVVEVTLAVLTAGAGLVKTGVSLTKFAKNLQRLMKMVERGRR